MDSWDDYVFMVSFFVQAGLAIVFLVTFFVHVSEFGYNSSTMGFPIFKSLYTNVYGQPIGSQHVTLFGETSVLKTTMGGTSIYMPMAPLPLSFDSPSFAGQRSYTYYYCNDTAFTSTIPSGDWNRQMSLCHIERSKQVAMYQNDPVSLTFSSAWNSLFMSMVVLWLYASWALLLWNWGEKHATWKWIVYSLWQVFIFVTVLISAIFQVDNTVIPRNNIIYSLLLITLTMVQQFIIMFRSCRIHKRRDDVTDFGDILGAINIVGCIRNLKSFLYVNPDQRKDLSLKWYNENESYRNYRIVNVILSSQIFLFPTLVLCLYTIAVNKAVEWSIQAAWVRFVIIIFGLMMLNYRKINPITIGYFKAITKLWAEGTRVKEENARANAAAVNPVPVEPVDTMASARARIIFPELGGPLDALGKIPESMFGYSMWRFKDTSIVVGAFFLVWVNLVIYDDHLLRSVWNNPDTSLSAWSGFICFVLGVALVAFGNMVLTTRNKFVVFYNCAVFLFITIILSVVIIDLVVGVYARTYCTFAGSHKFFCGNAPMMNLNSEPYLGAIKVEGTDFASVYSAIQPTLTFKAI